MNYFKKRIEKFQQQIVNDITFKLNRTLSDIRIDIINLAKENKALPAFVTIEAPDGRTGVSNIIWLTSGNSGEVKIIPYTVFPIGSLIKIENPFLISQLRIGDIYQLGSEGQTCRSLNSRSELSIAMQLRTVIIYPVNG